jgi:hypothetical protein
LEENLPRRSRQRLFEITQTRESPVTEQFWILDPEPQQGQEYDTRDQYEQNEVKDRSLSRAPRHRMQQVQCYPDEDDERYDPEGRVPVQAQAKENPGQDKVIAILPPQAANQEI